MLDTDITQNANGLSAAIDSITRLQLELMKGNPDAERRGQHYKQHGCVRAQFEVLSDISARYKVGLFAKPATYTAYVRFSNGMAIKLTGVPGRKVLEDEARATTHDFILADNPVFFIHDTDEYVRFMKNFAETAPFGKLPLKFG